MYTQEKSDLWHTTAWVLLMEHLARESLAEIWMVQATWLQRKETKAGASPCLPLRLALFQSSKQGSFMQTTC